MSAVEESTSGNKRRRVESSSEDVKPRRSQLRGRDFAVEKIESALAALTSQQGDDSLPQAQFDLLFDKLNEAYKLARAERRAIIGQEDVKAKPGSIAEDAWDWKIDPMNLKNMTNEDLTVYAALSLVHERLAAKGIHLKPQKKDQTALGLTDQLDFKRWSMKMAGPKETDWEGGVFNFIIRFGALAEPPKIMSSPPLFHANIYPSGSIYYAGILHRNPHGGCEELFKPESATGHKRKQYVWKEGINLAECMLLLLIRIQSGLALPCNDDPAQTEAFALLRKDPEGYAHHIRE